MTDGKRRAGLGRGLSALLGDAVSDHPRSPEDGSAAVRTLPIEALVPHPDQPRRQFDQGSLDELAGSIAAKGLIQPIVVRPHGQNFQIVAGERRWRAAQRARLHEVPVIVREFADDETLEIALLENIQRQDLNAIEEARAYRKLVDEFGHTQEELGGIVHKSRSHVANLLRLLDLPDTVQLHVMEGRISMGHARALLSATAPDTLADLVIARALSVRDTEKLVRDEQRERRSTPSPGGSTAPVDPDIVALERHLADLLGLSVKVAHTGQGGTLSLEYSSLDQLDMLCQRLTGETI